MATGDSALAPPVPPLNAAHLERLRQIAVAEPSGFPTPRGDVAHPLDADLRDRGLVELSRIAGPGRPDRLHLTASGAAALYAPR